MPELAAMDQTTAFIVAQRHFLVGLASTIFGTLRQTKSQFDEFAGHVRSQLGIVAPGFEGDEKANAVLEAALKHFDTMAADVRRQLPD